jgi:D-arabinose 1-dehydrogenase-like Zn-dependent alcohol dehydrogenase
MRAWQFTRQNGSLEQVEREIPAPPAGTVRVKVEACGVCHSDVLSQFGGWAGIQWPRVPGHEVAGVIDVLGAGVSGWKAGERVGVGWHGFYDGTCDQCRRGDFFACRAVEVTGISFDGGYAEYMIAPVSALARIPEELPALDAAPLMCAGVTTYNSLRNNGARPGDVVAILGVGGLGHLGVQFGAKMGFRTIAIARGADKAVLAKKLGAWRYLDSKAQDVVAELGKLGGARAIMATVTSGSAMSAVLGGLAPRGKLFVIGAGPEPVSAPMGILISKNASIEGWYSGTSIDSEDTLQFSLLTGVRSMNEVYPMARAPEAYARMLSGDARFRVVLDMRAA